MAQVASPRRALGARALDKLGPFGSEPYGGIARGARQLGGLDVNPFNPAL
jgi:hypothetical protein